MEIPPTLPPAVARMVLRLTLELGDSYAFAHLTGFVERGRGKQLRIEEDRMPPGMTGYSVALSDCDLIATRPGLSALQKRTTVLHEMSHFILGHIPLLSVGTKTPDYAVFIQRRTRFENVLSRQRVFDSYATPQEREAEALARLCLQSVLAHERTLPEISIDIYGDR